MKIHHTSALAHVHKMGSDFNAAEFKAELSCEPPNNRIYEFTGHLKFQGDTVIVDSTNMLLRGCVIRNTRTTIGMVSRLSWFSSAMSAWEDNY